MTTTTIAPRLERTDSGYAGQADYTPAFLAVYDPLVLGLMNRVVWRCPTRDILALYHEHARGAHLDVGPGTGWYLDHCRFGPRPRSVTLLDVNPDVLAKASRRLVRFAPTVHRANLLEPTGLPPETFDSIALTHVLHCLPGPMTEKAAVLGRLAPLLAPGGTLFGSTILAGGVPRTPAARALTRFLNARGVFGNRSDDLAALESALGESFAVHEVRTVGSVALFAARR
jgi:SAM-dependent methyltransferase